MSSVAAQLEEAVALHRQGQLAEAQSRYRDILRADPANADAHYYLAMAACHEGRFAEGVELARKAAAGDARNARAHKLIGMALQNLGRPAEALESLDRAVAAEPQNAELHGLRAELLTALRRPDEAIASFERALAIEPGSPLAHAGLASLLQEQGRDADAVAHYRQALAAEPRMAPAHLNLARILSRTDQTEEALRSFQAAVQLEPDNAEAQADFGYALQLLDRNEEALAHLDRALALKPDFPRARWNKALLLLSLGRFAEGWPLFESRRAAIASDRPRGYAAPPWDGRVHDGSLMVWSEYGLGDQILHASMISDAAAVGMPVILECEPRLVPLFARSFSGVTVIPQAPALYPGAVARQISLASLGQFFRPGLASFPRKEYLKADPALTQRLRERLRSDGRAPVGLSWKSQRAANEGRAKTAPLADFESLFRRPGLRFVDLQYGDTHDERARIERQFGVQVEHLDEVDNTQDIDALAALVSACSAVLTVSNTTAHLAGALGVPTFVLVPYGHANWWYWLKKSETCPWYPQVRLLHRARGQPWAELIEQAARDISSVTAKA